MPAAKRGTIMERFRATLRLPEFQVLLFCFCCVLFGWPLLLIVDQKHNETIFIYLFMVWGLIVLGLFLIARSLDLTDSDEIKHGNINV